MTKLEFLQKLRNGLNGLPQKDVEDRVFFYSEMIADRIEEGMSESEAVSSVGPVDDIISQILNETPLTRIAKERIKPKRHFKAWEIILLVLGSPIWFSLGIAAIAVIFSLYVVFLSVIFSLWAVFGALIGCSIGFAFLGVITAINGDMLKSVAIFGVALVCIGVSIFAFYGCKRITILVVNATKHFVLWIKNLLLKREGA